MKNIKYTVLFMIAFCLLTNSCSVFKDNARKLYNYLLHYKQFAIDRANNGILNREFYLQVYRWEIDKLEIFLQENKSNIDPDYCNGIAGWVDSNPLSVVADDFYDTYIREAHGEVIPVPTPDIAVFNLLIDAGADINKRPYLCQRVCGFDSNKYNKTNFTVINNEILTDKQMQEQLESYVKDTNRLIKAFLEAGADPDMLGHPYPFTSQAMEASITEEKAQEYFKKGDRAINYAIEKGVVWESQVDLLLQYTKLDEKSLEAAERSKDPKMIDKINKLWKNRIVKHI